MTAACIDARLWRPEHVVSARENPQVGEAQAWWSGRLDLTERHWDTALKDGKIYSHFPLMFSLIAAAFGPLTWGVPHWFIVFGVVLPIPVLTYVLLHRRTGSARWATLLTLALIMGTSAWPVLRLAVRSAGPYYVNHALSLVGSLVFLIEYFGKRRTWLAAAGVTVATLSRQMTAALFLPLACMAWEQNSAQRPRAVAAAAAFFTVTIALNLTLNALKFGHPLDTGYQHIYEGRPPERLSSDAVQHGVFSPRFIPRNLYYSNLGLPEVHSIQGEFGREMYLTPNELGTGIWWTTPLLILLIIEWRRLFAEPRTRCLLLAGLAIYGALLFFHGTGYVQRGFNRFSLDYMPIVFASIAPACMTGWRRWAVPLAIGWSVLYFAVIAPMPHLRVW